MLLFIRKLCKVSVPIQGTYLPFPVAAIIRYWASHDFIFVGKKNKFLFNGHTPVIFRKTYDISGHVANAIKSPIHIFQTDTFFLPALYISACVETLPAVYLLYCEILFAWITPCTSFLTPFFLQRLHLSLSSL